MPTVQPSAAEGDVTEHLCVVCPVLYQNRSPRAPEAMPVCEGCRARVQHDLEALPAAYDSVQGHVEPNRSTGARTVGYESKLPLNVAALSLLGPGSVLPSTQGTRMPRDQLDTVPPRDLLAWWVEDWIDIRRQREHMPVVNVSSLVGWLVNRIDWALDEHQAIDEFARDVAGMTRSMRSVNRSGENRGESAGRCPMLTRNDTACGTRLYVDPYVDQIACSHCGTTWDRRRGQWLKLRALQLEREANANSVA